MKMHIAWLRGLAVCSMFGVHAKKNSAHIVAA